MKLNLVALVMLIIGLWLDELDQKLLADTGNSDS